MSRWKIVLLTAIAGCVSACGEKPAARKLVVLCGSSFVPPTEQLIDEFKAQHDVEVEYTTAGSEDFLPQVKAAQLGDILITHDPYLDHVRDAGRLSDSVHVGFVAPVLAVRPGNPKQLRGIDDLTRPGLRVALTDAKYSTCGEMVFALLKKKGLVDAVMANVGNRLTKGHSTLGNFLKTDAVDAVVMWNGVANTFGADVQIVATTYEYDTEIRVHVIGLNYAHDAELLRQFMDFAKSRGQAIFARHGYVK